MEMRASCCWFDRHRQNSSGDCTRRGGDEKKRRVLYPARIWCSSSSKPAMPARSRGCSNGSCVSTSSSSTNATSSVMWSRAPRSPETSKPAMLWTPHYWSGCHNASNHSRTVGVRSPWRDRRGIAAGRPCLINRGTFRFQVDDRIPMRRVRTRVTEPVTDGDEVDTGLEEVNRGAVSKAVGMEPFGCQAGTRGPGASTGLARADRTPNRVSGAPR